LSILSRPGLRVCEIKSSSGRVINHVVEVENPGEIERLRDYLLPAEYDAALDLRGLWAAGSLNPEARASAVSRLGLPRVGFSDNYEDHRLEAHDRLKAALRAMGSMGMAGRYAIEVVIYDRKVATVADLALLRDTLARLAAHGIERRRAAQGLNPCASKCASASRAATARGADPATCSDPADSAVEPT
jgi:hypothetical protein